jgi:hypothetical protein
MAFTDKSFVEYAKWLAFERNRFSWPKHWQVAIFKITRVYYPLWGDPRYSVLPANPDYQVYLDEVEPKWAIPLPTPRAFPEPPPMHLDPIVFDSMEDIDQWAAVAHRLR